MGGLTVDFFANLTLLGWIGCAVPVGYILLIVLKPQWFWIFNYYERKPYIKAFDEYMYTEARQIIFMAVRALVGMMISIMIFYLFTTIGTDGY